MSNRILIVDDEHDLASMMADMLNDAGYTTRIFDNGRDAIVDIHADPPDLLLLDVNMPGLDGFALAAALRADKVSVQEVNFAGTAGSLAERPEQARGSDFFISVHHDSISPEYLQFWDWDGEEASHTTLKRGFGLFVSRRNPDLAGSLRCASAMGAMLRRAGFAPTPWHARKHQAADEKNGVWYYDNLVVLHKSTFPAVLFEAGVIKHREEELELLDPERQARMADALATGIAACLAVRGKSARE